MAKINFTAVRIDSHVCLPGKDQSFLWDSHTPGLALRATAKGVKAYIFQGKINARTVRVTIGDPRSWNISEARKEAARLQVLIDSGVDPREHRAAQTRARETREIEASRQDVTFSTAWERYIAVRKSYWSVRHYQDHINLAALGGEPRKRGEGLKKPGPLADLNSAKLASLSGEYLAQWLEAQAIKRPTMAALSYRLLRAFIRWCVETPAYTNIIPQDAYKARGIRDVLPKANAKLGDCLQREQLRNWFEAVQQNRNPVIKAYLQALLLTGARREEMAALKWADVDFQWNSLSLGDKVEKGGRLIPLTPYLSSTLTALPKRNQWVFSSPTSRDGKISEPRIAHNKALAAAGLPLITLHGLRRSFGTLSEWCEVPVGIVAQIMGHKPSAIAEKHYRRRPLDLLRMWHVKIEAWMLEQAGLECPQTVFGNQGLRAVN